MKTGLADTYAAPPTAPLMKLLLGFLVVFQRQVYARGLTFLYHNGQQGQANFDKAVLDSLKFSTLSPNGVACALRPYLHLAFDQGYLSEEDCGDNEFALRALSFFPQVHAAWEKGGEKGALTWVHETALQILTDSDVLRDEALLAGDVDDDDEDENMEDGIEDDNMSDDESDESEIEEIECTCDFCEEFRGYRSVDMAQIKGDGPVDEIIIGSVKRALVKGTSKEK